MRKSINITKMNHDLASFAHDVKNSLSIIKLNLNYIKKLSGDEDPIYQKASNCLNQVDICTSFCNSRILEQRETFLLSELIADCHKDLKASFNRILFRIISTEDKKLTVDRFQFKNFILNLVKNAFEAEATNIAFYLRGNRLVVVDDGHGFPAKVLLEQQADSNGLRGHGLVSMKNFCESMGWSLNLSNNEDGDQKGSRIVVFFD